MGDLCGHQARLDCAKRSHDHLRINMPHMPNAEKPIRIRIVICGHIQADAQRQTGLMLGPTA